jgi:hypothetical protein
MAQKKQKSSLEASIEKLLKEFQSKTPIDPELKFQFSALNALDIYKNKPELFNAYPEDYYPDDAKVLIEYFCICVEQKKDLRPELLDYFRDCFRNILKGGLSTNRCLHLSGRPSKNPYLPPDYLDNFVIDIIDNGLNLTEACKQAHMRGVDKNEKTIMQHFKEFNIFLFDQWIDHQEANNKKIILDLKKDVTKTQYQAIKKHFKSSISAQGYIKRVSNGALIKV